MKISIIIPVYNSSLTLNECLTSLFKSTYRNFEVIIVSDNCTDNSVEIAKKYKTKIIDLLENKGPANARNVGSKSADGDILLFIDSDVILSPNSLNIITDNFSNEEVNAIQGIYSHNPNYKTLATQFYQSYLSYYVWSKDKKYASTLVTGCFSIRKKIFEKMDGFDVNIKNASCEDEKFGYSLIANGYKILIVRNLQVEHRVSYGTIKFIKRRFNQDLDRVKFYLREKAFMNKIKQKNYSNVIIGIPIIGLIILNFFTLFINNSSLFWSTFILLNFIYIFLHIGFIKFIAKTKGFKRAFGSLIIFYIDTCLMLFALSYGFVIFFLFKKKY